MFIIELVLSELYWKSIDILVGYEQNLGIWVAQRFLIFYFVDFLVQKFEDIAEKCLFDKLPITLICIFIFTSKYYSMLFWMEDFEIWHFSLELLYKVYEIFKQNLCVSKGIILMQYIL